MGIAGWHDKIFRDWRQKIHKLLKNRKLTTNDGT